MPIDKEMAAASACENEASKTVGIFGERMHNGTESATAGQKDKPVDKEGVTWPGWETVRLIGRGSFGTVYEIQRDIFGDIEKAALKVISIPQNASDIDEMYSDGYDEESITSTFKSHLKSIVAEYSLMRKMNGCTNIVNCDDVRYVQHDDGIGWDIFIKMELLTPLAKALTAQVSEETIIKIAKDICTALELCKKHEIVHRDIKPQNIFVSPNGDYKLGDFGIAKTVEKTMGGTKIGTYKYMAPEVYNNKPYGSSADIYSLGLVLYWLLNERRMPFLPLPPMKLSARMDEAARTRRLSGEQFPEPKNGSTELKAIVMKACAYDVNDRYASASEMHKDLQRIEHLCSEEDKQCKYQSPQSDEKRTVGILGTKVIDDMEAPDSKIEDRTVGIFFDQKGKHSDHQEQTAQTSEKNKEPARNRQEENSFKTENDHVEQLTNHEEEETWRKSEAAYREWKNLQKSQTANNMTQKLTQDISDMPISMLKQSHEYWSKKTVMPRKHKHREQSPAKEDIPIDDWRRSEAAHRAWLKSLEKSEK